MITKRPTRVEPLTDRETVPAMTVNGRQVERGTELRVDKIRGRCVFVGYTRHDSGTEWVDVITSRGFARSIRPEAIVTVHRGRTAPPVGRHAAAPPNSQD